MSGAVLSYQQKDPMIIIDSKSLPIPVLATVTSGTSIIK